MKPVRYRIVEHVTYEQNKETKEWVETCKWYRIEKNMGLFCWEPYIMSYDLFEEAENKVLEMLKREAKEKEEAKTVKRTKRVVKVYRAL